ncbi:MAG: T9SS C-terminal target domain-containing protein [Bacteroidetes bacterium]|nr:MAG: T9SS C-terminal target domain-containing protein [Bacteroidota bacterium]
MHNTFSRHFLLILVFFILTGSFNHLHSGVITPALQQKIDHTLPEEKIRINIRLKDQYPADALQHLTRDIHEKEQIRKVVTRELKDFSRHSQQDLLALLENQLPGKAAGQVRTFWLVNLVSCYASRDLIEQIAAQPYVARVDYDRMEHVLSGPPPTPLHTGDKLEPRTNTAWNVSHINTPLVWEQGYTGAGVVVAVLDTGVNSEHTDLAGRMWQHPDFPNHGYNFVDNNHNTHDGQSHGTHCAGTVAGNGTSGTATGIAPGATIMALKVLNDQGSGTESGVWAGIEFAVEHGAQVLSLSLGWPYSANPDRAAWRTVMVNAMNAGVIAAVAAGNEGQGGFGTQPPPNNIRTPGDCPGPWSHPDQLAAGGNSAVVTVGATTDTDEVASFSSIGPVTWQNVAPFNDYELEDNTGLLAPDVVAPGTQIVSLSHASNTGYVSMSGTSMAAPAVAGLMALMLEKNPLLTPAEISRVLEESALALDEGKNNQSGSGRIDALAAVVATPAGIRYIDHTLNDSQGNDNGLINPGETISLSVTIQNIADEPLNDVVAWLETSSPFITITQPNAILGDFLTDETIEFTEIFTFEVSDSIPGNHKIVFDIYATSQRDTLPTWKTSFLEMAHAPFVHFDGFEVDDSEYGNNDGVLDPGETALLLVTLENSGQMPTQALSVRAETSSAWITLLLAEPLQLPALDPGETAQIVIPVVSSQVTPHETLAWIEFTATSGAHTFDQTLPFVAGLAPLYTLGDIPSTLNTDPNTLSQALEPGQMSVTLPGGATITGVDVEYEITSMAGAWVREQRSYVRCVSPGGIAESALASGPNFYHEGTAQYKRTGLTIANGVEGGGEVEFELHVFRTFGGSGSNTDYTFVPDSTWKIIVHYTMPEYDVLFKVENQAGYPVQGAQVKAGNILAETNTLGEAHLQLFEGTHYYNITAPDHHTLMVQPFEVTPEGKTLEVSLIRQFSVTFSVTNVHGHVLPDAIISLNGQTGSPGDYTFNKLEEISWEFSVEAHRHLTYEGEIQFGADDLQVDVVLVPIYDLRFEINSELGFEITDAVITLDGTTFQQGVYQIEDLVPGIYPFSVSAPNHRDYNGFVQIHDEDVVFEVTLRPLETGITAPDNPIVQIFPNPASETVNVVLPENSRHITFSDMHGRVLFSREKPEKRLMIDLSGWDEGIYILQVLTRDGVVSGKLQITR